MPSAATTLLRSPRFLEPAPGRIYSGRYCAGRATPGPYSVRPSNCSGFLLRHYCCSNESIPEAAEAVEASPNARAHVSTVPPDCPLDATSVVGRRRLAAAGPCRTAVRDSRALCRPRQVGRTHRRHHRFLGAQLDRWQLRLVVVLVQPTPVLTTPSLASAAWTLTTPITGHAAIGALSRGRAGRVSSRQSAGQTDEPTARGVPARLSPWSGMRAPRTT
jgi:hypothetical protein